MAEDKKLLWFKRIFNSNQSKAYGFTTLIIFAFILVFVFQNCKVDKVNLGSGDPIEPETVTTTQQVNPNPETPLNCDASEYNTRSLCDRRKPAHSTCSEQDNGCYAWSCNDNYTLNDNECVSNDAPPDAPEGQCEIGEHTSQRACDNDRDKPDNSTCQQQSSGCYAWECDTDYVPQGNECITCQSQNSCNTGKPNNATCSPDSNGCHTWSCDSGYTLVSRQCEATSTGCNDGEYSTQIVCNQNKPKNSTCSSLQNSSCFAWSCNQGYQKNGQKCVQAINGECAEPPFSPTRLCKNGTLVEESNLNQQWSCHGLNGGTNDTNCNRCPTDTYPFLAMCNDHNPDNSDCYATQTNEAGAGCYAWQCSNGYRLNTDNNECEQIPETQAIKGQCPESRPYDPNNKCIQGDYRQDTENPLQWHCDGKNDGGNAEDCNTCPSGFYPFESSCEDNNPTNSTCEHLTEGDQTGCWKWDCNTNYIRDGNSCVSACYNSESDCFSALPEEHRNRRGDCHNTGTADNPCWESVCPVDKQTKHWGVNIINGQPQCIASCGGAKGHYCDQSENDCTGYLLASGQPKCSDETHFDIIRLTSYDQPYCCIRKPKTTASTTTSNTSVSCQGINCTQCTCGETVYSCSDGCAAKDKETSATDYYRYLYYDFNRYARIYKRSFTWNCEANGHRSAACDYKQTLCRGGYKRGGNRYRYAQGFDGCTASNNYYLQRYGSSCTATADATSCTYVGYCDKSFGGSCRGSRCTTKTCSFIP